MTEVLGRPVEAHAVPPDQWAAVLGHMGLSPETAPQYMEMQDGVNSGWIDFGVPGIEHGSGSTSPTEVFKRARRA